MGVINFQPKGVWKSESQVITVAGSALTTDKSDQTVDALASGAKCVMTIPDFWIAMELRFKGVATDADSNVINIYAQRGSKDDYRLIATLTLTTGTQTDGTNLYVDTIVETVAFRWPSTVDVNSPAGNDMGTVSLNTHGYNKLAFIATTLNSTSIIVDIARAA
jgi:hypothetical protein